MLIKLFMFTCFKTLNTIFSVSEKVHLYGICTKVFLHCVLPSRAMAIYLPARRRPSGLVVSGVCLCVCVCVRALFLSARYLKNGFMDHHQIWWVGAGGEPLEEV